jgi:hypothetical protein
MLRLLLDENVTPSLHIQALRRDISIHLSQNVEIHLL